MSVTDHVRDTRTRAVVEVGVEVGIVIVLHAVILVTHAVVEGEVRRGFPAVLRVSSPVMVAVGTGEAGLRGGKRNQTAGGIDELSRRIVAGAGQRTPRVDSSGKGVDGAADKAIQPAGQGGAKQVVGLRVGSVGLVHLDVLDGTAELHRVRALGDGEVLVPLDSVLGAAGGESAPARELRVEAGQLDGRTAEGRVVEQKQRRCLLKGGVVGLSQIEAGEAQFGVCEHLGAEDMRNVQQD